MQTSIPAYAFACCDLLENVTLPAGTTAIGQNAFENCAKLSKLNSTTAGEVKIPTGVTEISASAFYNCKAVTVVTMGDVTTIGDFAFNGCTALTTLQLPDTLETIGDYAFAYCEKLEKVNEDSKKIILPSGLGSIGKLAFYKVSLVTEIKVPDTVTTIGYAAFNGCTSLVNLTIPFVGESEGANDASNSTLGHIFGDDSPTNSSNSTVYNDTYVTSSGTYTTQGYYSSNRYYFAIPKSLKNVTVTVQTTIPDYAFACCDLIESVTYTNTVGQIGTNAFELCTASQHFTLS